MWGNILKARYISHKIKFVKCEANLIVSSLVILHTNTKSKQTVLIFKVI